MSNSPLRQETDQDVQRIVLDSIQILMNFGRSQKETVEPVYGDTLIPLQDIRVVNIC